MSEIDLKKLSTPFPSSEIQWRIGSTNKDKTKGLALAYYDCRALYDRLDAVCGVENWQIRYPHANGKTCAEIGIRVNGEWVWKANGAGDSQMEAEKGAFSDAAKRAGVPWGIGRYLYEMTDTWVEIEPCGKSFRIKKGEHTKLDRAYEKFVKDGVKPTLVLGDDDDDQKPTVKLDTREEIKMLLPEIRAVVTVEHYKIANDKILALKPRLSAEQIIYLENELSKVNPNAGAK